MMQEPSAEVDTAPREIEGQLSLLDWDAWPFDDWIGYRRTCGDVVKYWPDGTVTICSP